MKLTRTTKTRPEKMGESPEGRQMKPKDFPIFSKTS